MPKSTLPVEVVTAEGADGKKDDAAAKAARKAARKAAKLAAADASPCQEEPQEEDDEAAAKAARKAAKKAARLAAEAHETQDAEEAQSARKTAKKAARLVAEAACDPHAGEEHDAEEARAARKAAKKAARLAAEAAQKDEEEAQATAKAANKSAKQAAAEPACGSKRKADAAAQDAESRRQGDAGEKKLRKTEGSNDVATQVLGPVAYREAHQVIASDDCPDPFETFEQAECHLGTVLARALKKQGYAAPTPIQAQGWPIALQGKDMVAVAKTGSGKTCGFLLPALARIAERGPAPPPKRITYFYSEPARPTVLVLAPTRELAQQIAAEAVKFAPCVKARVVSIYGGVPKGDQVRELKQGCDILIATPGRLLDLSRGDPARNIKPTVTIEAVTYLVLDEADRMLDMGFEPDIRSIVDQCPKTGKPEEGGGATGYLAGSMRQTLFFTATWPKEVKQTAEQFTSKKAVHISIGQGADGDKLTANANITQTVVVVQEDEKISKLKELLKTELHEGETAIVFAGMKCTCDDVVWELQRSDPTRWCETIHSGKEQATRDWTLAKFREITSNAKKGERGVLVATDVASRGLDIPGVALVVVYDFGRALNSSQNGGVESYVHRIGRTGRAGKSGRAWTLFTKEDCGAWELIELLQGAGQDVPAQLESLADSEYEERWRKSAKKDFYRKGGKGKGKGKGKDSGKGKAKGKGKSTGRGRGSS